MKSRFTSFTSFTSFTRYVITQDIIMFHLRLASVLFMSMVFASNPSPVSYWITRLSHKWLNALFPVNYSKFEPPLFDDVASEEPMVTFGIAPMSIMAMSPKEMTMTMEMRIVMWWKDPRLNQTVLNRISAPIFPFPRDVALKMWHPLFIFKNCKGCTEFVLDADFHELYYNRKENYFVMLTKGVYNFICRFDFSFYPFDTQLCSIEILTDAIDNSRPLNVKYKLEEEREEPINVPPEYKLVNKTRTYCNFIPIYYSSCYSLNFILRRDRTRPILLTFIPSMLIVFLSWTSFWLECEKAPARVALGLTTMLTLITHFNAVQQNLPAVSTIMPLDVWMFTCIFMVFLSLVEFAFVTYKLRKRKRRATLIIQTPIPPPISPLPVPLAVPVSNP